MAVGISVGKRVFVGEGKGEGVRVSVDWGVLVDAGVDVAVKVISGLAAHAEIENKNSGNRSNIVIFCFGCMGFKILTKLFPKSEAQRLALPARAGAWQLENSQTPNPPLGPLTQKCGQRPALVRCTRCWAAFRVTYLPLAFCKTERR